MSILSCPCLLTYSLIRKGKRKSFWLGQVDRDAFGSGWTVDRYIQACAAPLPDIACAHTRRQGGTRARARQQRGSSAAATTLIIMRIICCCVEHRKSAASCARRARWLCHRGDASSARIGISSAYILSFGGSLELELGSNGDIAKIAVLLPTPWRIAWLCHWREPLSRLKNTQVVALSASEHGDIGDA